MLAPPTNAMLRGCRKHIPHVFNARFLRTRRAVAPQVPDIESQLANYPPDVRSQIFDEARHAQTSGDRKDLSPEGFSAGLIADLLETAQSPADLDEQFWASVKMLARSVRKTKSDEYNELFVSLFEAAKDIEHAELRQDLLYETGTYIYRQRKVRFDPVNEVEYLDSMVANKRPFQALALWRSRKLEDSDPSEALFWKEVGVLYYLDAGLIHRANSMAVRLHTENSESLSPRLVTSMINAWSHDLRRNRTQTHANENLATWVRVLLEKQYSSTVSEHVLHSLIAARKWELSARLAEALPSEAINNFESKNGLLLLASTFNASTATEGPKEEDIMPFLEALLARVPSLASEGSVSASLILSFARQGDSTAALELLEDLNKRDSSYTPGTARALTRTLLRRSRATATTPSLHPLLMGPDAALEVLRHFRRTESAAKFVQSYIGSGAPLSPRLAFEILRCRAFNHLDEKQLLALGADHNSWRYLWYLSARNLIQPSPDELASAMPSAAVSVEQLFFMCYSFVRHSPSFEEGVTRLFKHLIKYGPATPTEIAIVLGSLKKSRFSSAIRRIPSKFSLAKAAGLPNGEGVPWMKVAEQVETYLRIPGLANSLQE